MARQSPINRRDFSRLAALGGSVAFFARSAFPLKFEPLLPTPASPDEKFWDSVRSQFLLAPGLCVMNAANLCPSSSPVLESLYNQTRDVDQDPSMNNRAKMTQGKETVRRQIAEFLCVTPEEIIITRNTSEANNLVSNGIDLKAGDEVIAFSDNHPSNLQAWQEKARRFGFTIKMVQQANPHPGLEYYVKAFEREMTPRTKVLALTHLTSTVGDMLPVKELCRMGTERGILSLVDGAQTLGVMDVDLSDMQPDFYSASAHKWPCGPKEVGVLYVNKRSHSKIWGTIFSAYPGAVGLSKTFEGFGQRDEPAIIAFGEALKFQTRIGRKEIEARSRELAQALMSGLKKIDGVKIWTHPDPARSLAVVSFLPGNLDPRKLSDSLYARDRIAAMTRGGSDRGGLRFSPHIYNSMAEVERVLNAVKRYMNSGL
jgi:isopenicillin-N epimerase